jgi:hypothetical protein
MTSYRRYTYVDFAREEAPTIMNVSRAAIITAADNQTDFFHTERGHYFEVYQECDAIQNVLLDKDSDGWQLFDLDTDGDSVQFTQGILASGTRMSFVAGTDAFFMKVKLDIPDCSIYDVCAIGFRKLAAYADVADAAALGTAYEDVAFMNCNGSTATATKGDVVSITRLAAGTADIDEEEADGWADGAQHTMEVHVTSAGVVTFKFDGAAVSGNANDLTITSAAVMIPTMIFTVTGDSAAIEAKLISYECGIA